MQKPSFFNFDSSGVKVVSYTNYIIYSYLGQYFGLCIEVGLNLCYNGT